MKDYTKYDYQALVDKMTVLLSEQDGWGDGYDSSTGQTLIQLMADVTDNLHYMLERRTRENYLQTASLRNSVVARACELGYRALRSKGNTGRISINIVDADGEPVAAVDDIVIPKLTELSYDGSVYVTVDDYIIEAGETGVDNVNIKEGQKEVTTYTVDETGIVLISDYDDIDDNVFIVSENGVEYRDVFRDTSESNLRALIFAGPDDRYYDIRYVVNGMRVVFGDNTFGKRPEGDVTFSFIRVNGLAEPITTIGVDFQFVDEAPVDMMNNEYTYSITNTTKISGASGPEAISSVKTNAVQYHRSSGRAVTNSDFEYWVLRSGIGNIRDVRVFGEYELDSLVYNLNNVYITYVTDSGEDLSVSEKNELLSYLNNVKASFVHVVFINSAKLNMIAELDVRKDPTIPIADAELYNIIRNFLLGFFELDKGSIGREVHLTDIVHELYNLRLTRNQIEYKVVDFVRLVLKGMYPFSYPLRTNRAFVELAPGYTAVEGHQFVLNIENLVCLVDVEETDTNTDILLKMRDKILEVTPFGASVQLIGIAYDAFGNPIPVEINSKIGYNLLIGVDTPYFSPTSMVGVPVVGSSIVQAVIQSDAIDVQHFYYSSKAGRRPMIPLRIGTAVTFTAPTDTGVEVYTRLVADDEGTESLFYTLDPGELFNETFSGEHVVQFEYLSDSSEDAIVDISYPSFDGTSFGLTVFTVDNFGKFDIITSSGDLSSDITVDYQIDLPVSESKDSTLQKILPGSLSISSLDGVVVFRDRGNGFFEDTSGVLQSTGSINYFTGRVSIPQSLADGDYIFIYNQDVFGNFSVNSSQVIQLVEPKPSLNSGVSSLSKIRIV